MFSFDIGWARRCIVALAILAMSSLSLAGAQAAQLVNTTPDGVAMDGYDPVNYFTEQKAAKGSSDFHAEWNGATYWFVSAEHRDAFAANPAKYAPQYNGWCAWAVSEGYAAEVDVIDGWLVHATGMAAAAGVSRLFLEVAEDNWAARRLYAALGFAPVGRRRNYYRRGQSMVAALTMRLLIRPGDRL